ncbi:MAG TPA: hypothetical protein ENJ60_15280 [Aeromonadales bacterium]|nr:hypothetical protein [Aeromonadales bacterium]
MKTYKNTIAKLLVVVTLFGLVACGGGGGTTDPGVKPPPPPPPGTKPVDTDGDGLTDEEETALGTNINVQDTDGDGFLDKEEADNWDKNSGTHLRFNPLVADVPRIRIERLGAPVIQLYATTVESVSVNRGMTNSALSEVQVTTDRGRSNTNVVEEQHAVNVNAEVKKRGPITTGKVAASYDYQHTDTTTETDYWNERTVETNRQESSDYFEFLRTNTIETKGGEIKILMGILNDGDISYTLKNMDLTAYMENPQRPGDLISVGTLIYEGDMNFTPDPLGTAVNPGSGDYTPFNFVYKAVENPEEISRILENSNQLVLRPTNLSLTGQRSDVDLNLAAQNVRARTAEVIIDFGDTQTPKTERYRVAVDTGNGDTLSFSDLMSNRLNFSFDFSSQSFPGKTGSHNGLTSVRSLAMNTATNSYWLVAHTFSPAGNPAGTTETKMYNILSQDYTASDINLRKGDVLHLVYITDTDLDGLSDRLEVLKGTDLNLADTDNDGLDDALEVYGWYSNLSAPPCDAGSDLSLVFSDPLKADTDADGNSDQVEFDNCSNPQGELKVNAGLDVLGNTSEKIKLEATPSNFQNRSNLRYSWTQTAGTSVGSLPNTASISFDAPALVDKLEFEVIVTDASQMNVSASDKISVFVLRDKTKSVFVEPDSGHDFNNDGRSPDSPLKTVERALDSSFGGADIYLNTPDSGSYVLADTLVLPSGANLYGGFDVNWAFDPLNTPTPILVNQAVAISAENFTDKTIRGISIEAKAPADGKVHSQAIYAANGSNLIIREVIAQGSDLTVVQPADADIASFNAASSYGVLAMNLDRLDVLNSFIHAGKGADGVKGLTGAPGRKGNKGSDGTGRNGGSGGKGHNGVNGGTAGTAVKGVVDCTAGKVGAKGGNSISNSNAVITGGTKGAAGKAVSSFLKCTLTGGGGGGSVFTRAKTGTQGTGAQNSSVFSSGFFVSANGVSVGGQGTGGAGGGGGGSGPGHNFDDGGGGGGGGEGGEGGAGGQVGRGAGGSFGLAVSAVNFVSVSNSEISSGNGGAGGAGGSGGVGGSGGKGGTGADTGARKGGKGGTGAPGGYGGSGGGGAAGPVASILLLDGSELDMVDSTIITGNAGNGVNPNRGQGGWNYGVYILNSTFSVDDSNTYQLGTSGNDAEVPADRNP